MTGDAATASWYARAAIELAGTSALQSEWARGVSTDDSLLAPIADLPREHRQPSLVFSVAQWCGAPAAAYPAWRRWVLAHWDAVATQAAQRRTQTNEVGRCVLLLLALSRFDGPIALLEIGASAGLCLAVDRYAYRFDDAAELRPAEGAGSPVLTASLHGANAPTRVPEIVWRAGIDLAPLDVHNSDDMTWLEACLPPDRPERLARLRAAVDTVRADPPRLIAGDALAALATVARQAPPDATLVVASLGTLVYLPPADRAAIPDAVAALGAHLVAFEAAAALPHVVEHLAKAVDPLPAPFVLSLDGEPLACATAHGDRVWWLHQS
jgi:hypothetical protein